MSQTEKLSTHKEIEINANSKIKLRNINWTQKPKEK